jgi:antitoxin component YwqK of YwqJK toxin-antitoxin module
MKAWFLFLITAIAGLSACNSHSMKREYWPGGTLKSDIRVLHDTIYDGPASWYYENGTLQMRCLYRNNRIDSLLIRYYPEGKKKEAIRYRMGKEEGMMTEWAPDGRKSRETNFRNGLKDGPYREYYPNGSPRVEGRFSKGLFDGKWLYFNEDGDIVGEGVFHNGTGTQKAFYPGGSIMRQVNYVNNLKEGAETIYSEKGKITRVITYKEGKVTGTE